MTNRPSETAPRRGLPKSAKIALIVCGALAALCLIAVGVFLYLWHAGKRDMTRVPADDAIAYNEIIEYRGRHYVYNTNMIAVALIGVDKRTLGDDSGSTRNGMADVTALFIVDGQNGKATLLTVPRDTVCDVDIYQDGILTRTKQMQICASFGYGDGKELSCENTVRSMRRLLYGIPVQKYICLDLDGIAPLNDALGGVTLTAQIDLPQYGVKSGDEITLTGEMTESYLRYRSHEELDAAYRRAERQEQYFSALASKLRDTVRKDLTALPKLYATLTEYTLTDITLENVTYLATLFVNRGVDAFHGVTLQGEYSARPIEDSDDVYALFTPDPDALYQTVIDLFYLPID